MRARRRSAKRQGWAGPARWKRGRRRWPLCVRVHRPHRAHPSAPPLMSVSAVRDRRPRGSRSCAEQRAGSGADHRTDANTQEGGGSGGVPPPRGPPPKVARRRQPRRSARARRPGARVRRTVGPARASVGTRVSVSPVVRGSAPAVTSASVGPCLSRAARVGLRRCAHVACQHALSETSSTVTSQSILDRVLDHQQGLHFLKELSINLQD